MRDLLPELRRVFNKNRLGIALVLVLDVAVITILSLNPYVIGSCIDGVYEHNYFWLYVLIGLELLFVIVRAADKIIDTRIYEPIIETERNAYYEKIIQTDADDSQISSRLNLVNDIPNFFEFDLVQIINMVGGIALSLIFILISSGLMLFLSAIVISALVYFLTKRFHKEIESNNIKLQNHDEKREEIISNRNGQQFRIFTRKILNLSIVSSDLDAKANLVTDLLQAGFLVFAIVFTIYLGDYTGGQLFSIITYIIMLNEYVCEINEIRVTVYDLIDTITRLKRNEE